MNIQRTRLSTWGGRSIFEYSGSISMGTRLYFGENFRWEVTVPRETYSSLLQEFSGKSVLAGTSKTDPPSGSLGEWLIDNLTRQALASYIAAILVHEKYAQKDRQTITFIDRHKTR